MTNLKPCPFCGGYGEPTRQVTNGVEHNWSVICLDCRSCIDDTYDSVEEAAEAWNTRAWADSELDDSLYNSLKKSSKLVSDWQPIETVPKDGAIFIGYCAKGRWGERIYLPMYFHREMNTFVDWATGTPTWNAPTWNAPITHWLPLPEGPE